MIKKENEELLSVNRYLYIGNQRKINDEYRISMSSSTLLDISSTYKNQLRKCNKWKYFYYLSAFWLLMDQAKQCQHRIFPDYFFTFWNLERGKKKSPLKNTAKEI